MRISDWSSDVCSSDLFHVRELPRYAACLRIKGESNTPHHARLARIRERAPLAHDLKRNCVRGGVGLEVIMQVEIVFDAAKRCGPAFGQVNEQHIEDRKSTRLNSSH